MKLFSYNADVKGDPSYGALFHIETDDPDYLVHVWVGPFGAHIARRWPFIEPDYCPYWKDPVEPDVELGDHIVGIGVASGMLRSGTVRRIYDGDCIDITEDDTYATVSVEKSTARVAPRGD
jgi:hypothetical protein